MPRICTRIKGLAGVLAAAIAILGVLFAVQAFFNPARNSSAETPAETPAEVASTGLWPSPDHIKKVTFVGTDHLLSLPVDVTELDDPDLFVISDYAQVWLLNVKNATIKELANDTGLRYERLLEKRTFNPAGVYYSKPRKLLFVANFQLGNVLAFAVDIAKAQLTLQFEVKTPDLKGPEGVATNAEGTVLLVTDQDGNHASAFDLTSPAHNLLWKTPILIAHGICAVDDKVYVTSMAERRIYELDLLSGKVLRSVGKEGFSPDQEEFLWPAFVVPIGLDKLAVTDGHTGYVSILDRKTLRVTHYFGGNGPGYWYLNNPGNMVVRGETYYLVSVFQRRLIIGNTRTWDAESVIRLDPLAGDFEWMRQGGVSKDELPLNPKKWVLNPVGWGYQNRETPLQLFNHGYYLSYGRLITEEQAVAPFRASLQPCLGIPLPGSLYNVSSNVYFSSKVSVKNGIILFSSSSAAAFYITNQKDIDYCFPILLNYRNHSNLDNWLVRGKLVAGAGEFPDLEKQIAYLDRAVFALQAGRSFQDRVDKILQVLTAYAKCHNLLDRKDLSREFTSQPGKAFYQILTAAHSEAEIIQGAEDYYQGMQKEVLADLAEVALVEMIAGVPMPSERSSLESVFHPFHH